MNSLNLGGHSGCRIFLIEADDGSVFVRKTSGTPAYNDRLQAQCAKQRAYRGNYVLAPAVLGDGTDEEGCYFFDMEYIRGVTLAEYIKTMEIGKIRGLVTTLVDALIPAEHPAVDAGMKEVVRCRFKDKLGDLKQRLVDRDNPHITAAMRLLYDHDWGNMYPSSCHGDLTLENIIVRDDRLYLIDFLDSFHDSWILDMGTLLQDVQSMWSYRKVSSVSMNTVLRLIVFRDLLLDAVRAIEARYVDEMYYALLMKLVRIYPYTTDQLTLDFLDEKLEQVMERLEVIRKGDPQ